MDQIAKVVTSPFFGIIISLVIIILPYYLKNILRSTSVIKTVVSTLGILGTFIGIVGGLYLFNAGEITNSIPSLLGGLKTAFLTSIAGMSASLLMQIRPSVYGIKETEDDDSQEELLGNVLSELKSLNKNIAGEGDTSLTTQIVKMRSDNNDNHKEFIKSFDEFAEKMAKANTEELIKSIQRVMEDFNTKINDQLGESFKELSDSVTNLVEWQKDYKLIIESSTEALKVVEISLKKSSDSLTNTSEKVSQIAENNKKIEELNEEFKLVIEKLNQMLESSVGFSQGMKSLSEELNGTGESIRKEVKDIIEGSVQYVKSNTEEATRNINSMMENSLKNMQNNNNDTLKNFEEINMKTLQDFGGHLASIAGKLAEDFEKVQKALSIK